MAATWLVRAAGVHDAVRLAELAAETFPLACPAGFDQGAIERHVRQRLSPDAFRINLADVSLEYLIATVGDTAVGYLLLATDGAGDVVPGRLLLELRQIYVRQQLHGSGLADELMAIAIERARQRGLAGVWLGTSKQNARAIAFYRRHGFRVAGERVFEVGGLPNEDYTLVRLAQP